jgi:hypothetical protein
MRRLLVVPVMLTLLHPMTGRADARLVARLDPATTAEVERLVEDARADGLPTEPLVSKALEGNAKRATSERIVAAVRAQLAALSGARAALGRASSETELVAGAGALLAGVPADSLTRLRETRPGKPLVVPLVVLADLMARKVPGDAAATAVLAVARAGALDADMLRMRERIERDIAGGMMPANAAMMRARKWAPGLRSPGGDRRPPAGGSGGTTQRLGSIATPTHQASLPVVIAAGAVMGGASLAGDERRYGSRAAGALGLGITPRLTIEAHTALLALDRAAASERRLVRSGARLRGGGPDRGLWLGAALERSLAASGPASGLQLGLGAWATPGDVDLALAIEQTNEHVRIATVLPPDRTPSPVADSLGLRRGIAFDDRLVRSTSALVSARWEHGRIGVQSVAGITVNRHISPRRWMQSSFDVALRPRLSFYATMGNPAPRWLALEPGLERSASLGFKLTSHLNLAAADPAESGSQAPGFSLRHLGEDWYVIEMRVRATGPVEVIGDFSAWEPRPLHHVTGNRWALAMRLQPGVHQIQVRVDGGMWSPPRGLPTASDGFSGDVGVFVAG